MATDRVYKWKAGTPFKADPNKVYAELEEIRKKSKLDDIEFISAKDVLDRARNPKTELHKCFEWNDSIAAEKHRMGIAGLVLRALVYDHYVIESAQTKQKQLGGMVVAPYVNTPKLVAPNVRAYERGASKKFAPTEIILRDDKLRDTLLSEISRAISVLRTKIQNYQNIAADKSFQEVDDHLRRASEAVEGIWK